MDSEFGRNSSFFPTHLRKRSSNMDRQKSPLKYYINTDVISELDIRGICWMAAVAFGHDDPSFVVVKLLVV